MSAWRRIFTFTNALRLAITLVVISAVALMVVVSGDHLAGQMQAGRQVSSAQTGGISIVPAQTSPQEGFSLETLEDTLLGTYLRLNQLRFVLRHKHVLPELKNPHLWWAARAVRELFGGEPALRRAYWRASLGLTDV